MISTLEWIPSIVIFLAVASASFGMIMLFRRRNSAGDNRDLPTTPRDDEATPDVNQLIASATLPPKMRELKQELRAAGLYEIDAPSEFTAYRALAALCVLAITALAMFLVEDQFAGRVFLVGLPLAALAYILPRVMLQAWRRRQTRAIERDLPLAIDLQVLCLSAGQGLVAALRQTATQLRRPSPILARELAIVCQHAELHSLEHALKQWSDRVQSPQVHNLALLLMQSERLGTDSAATLQELATSYRISSRQRAEAQANRTSFWMLFPSVFCFWVASAIILIAPTYQEFFKYRQRSGAFFDQTSQNIKTITNATGNPASNAAVQGAATSISKSK